MEILSLTPVAMKASQQYDGSEIFSIHEFSTEAALWWESSSSYVEVPRGYCYWWESARGQWIWHPGQGPCGPEGQGRADGNFVYPSGFSGGLTGFQKVNNDLMLYSVYDPKIDRSRGGQYVYLNDKGYNWKLRYFCNDHDNPDMYKDNSGIIVHRIVVAKYSPANSST